jgi:hypothetical protein
METKKNGADAPTIDLPADGSIPPELQREDTPEQRERIKEIVAADQRAATGAGIKTGGRAGPRSRNRAPARERVLRLLQGGAR